jgi:hypothetical protein
MTRQQLFVISRWVQKEVKKIVSDPDKNCGYINTKTLMGVCAIASVTLQKCLYSIKVKSNVVESLNQNEGSSHCWVELKHPKGRSYSTVIDLTSQQFNLNESKSWPDVLIMDFDMYNKLNLHPGTDTFIGEVALNSIKYWIAPQNPNTYKHEIADIVRRFKHQFGHLKSSWV